MRTDVVNLNKTDLILTKAMKRRVSSNSHQREPLMVGWGMTSIVEHGLGAAHRLHYA
jgi:hypothetical protein